MEKRVLAAIALSIAILFVFQYYQERELARSGRLRPTPPVSSKPSGAPAAPTPAPTAEEVSPPSALAPGDTHASPAQVVISGTRYRAVLSNQGALITSWILKNYESAKGEPFEMMPPKRGESGSVLPGTLIFEDAALSDLANAEPYEVESSGGGALGQEMAAPANLVLRLRRGALSVTKRFHFDKDNYLVDVAVTCEKDGRPLPGRLLVGQDIGPDTEHFLNPSIQLSAISNQAGKIRRESPPKDPSEVRRVEGEIRWIGLDMLYFTVIAIPQRPYSAFEMQRIPVMTTGLDGKSVERILIRLTVAEEGAARHLWYIGPKLQSALEAVKQADFSGVIDYGMFSILVRPLLAALIWLEKYIHNYGWAIVFLTFFLTLALFPFRLKQMVSMKKMQAVQPKIKEIQERYQRFKRTDPRRAQMNQEMMAVYKEHNVNPLGGCLPLLLQMPILFAFYQLLASSIELRHAPFGLWIADLATKDPFYVLPVVMGLTMIISQRMTPMAPGGDPTQAKVMMFMPVIFTVMFLNVSSGLNLYFLCSNVFSVAFQKIAERWMGDKRPQSKSRK